MMHTNQGIIHGMMSSWYGYGLIFQIIILALFFFVVYWIINRSSRESPEDILKRRYAKGELTKKEFNDLLKEVSQV